MTLGQRDSALEMVLANDTTTWPAPKLAEHAWNVLVQ